MFGSLLRLSEILDGGRVWHWKTCPLVSSTTIEDLDFIPTIWEAVRESSLISLTPPFSAPSESFFTMRTTSSSPSLISSIPFGVIKKKKLVIIFFIIDVQKKIFNR